MARILVVTSGLTGIFNASLKLIAKLKKLGHEVQSACPGRALESRLDFPHTSIQPIVRDAIVLIASDQRYSGIFGLLYKYLNREKRRTEAEDLIAPKDFVDLLYSFRPDIIFIDLELHEYIFQAFAEGIPIILLNQFFSVWTNEDLPDIQSKTIIGVGESGSKEGLRRAYKALLSKRNNRAQKMSLRSGGVSRREILLRMAKNLGFPKEYIGENLWPGPFLYRSLPTINMTLEELEFPHEKRENMYYVGPMVDLKRSDEAPKTIYDYTLENIFAEAQQTNAKLIFGSVGTMKSKGGGFLLKLVDSMRSLSDCILILSIGRFKDERDFRDRPSNVFIFTHVPQLEVLKKAAMAIVHGGIHTINECILLKVPMLIYSGEKADQNGNAARLIYHGIAEAGDRSQDEAKDIQRKIRSVLENQELRAKINMVYEKALNTIESDHFKNILDRLIP